MPKNLTSDAVRDLLESLPLPVKGRTPEENCVTWIRNAIEALQQAGCAEQLDVDSVLTSAIRQGDKVMKNGRPRKSEDMFLNLTSRPD